MPTQMQIPQTILDRLAEVNDIVGQHPRDIPMDVCAKFYGMPVDTFRKCVQDGNLGFCWKSEKGRRSFLVPTLQFYLTALPGVIGAIQAVPQSENIEVK